MVSFEEKNNGKVNLQRADLIQSGCYYCKIDHGYEVASIIIKEPNGSIWGTLR